MIKLCDASQVIFVPTGVGIEMDSFYPHQFVRFPLFIQQQVHVTHTSKFWDATDPPRYYQVEYDLNASNCHCCSIVVSQCHCHVTVGVYGISHHQLVKFSDLMYSYFDFHRIVVSDIQTFMSLLLFMLSLLLFVSLLV